MLSENQDALSNTFYNCLICLRKFNCVMQMEVLFAFFISENASKINKYTHTKKETSDFYGTVSFDPVKTSQQK